MDILTNNLQVNFICDEGSALISMDLDGALADLGNFSSGELVDLVFEQATITADTLYPNKPRADRRKQTAKKHRRAEQIADLYPIKDGNKNNLKKAIRNNKSWYGFGRDYDWIGQSYYNSCYKKKNGSKLAISEGLAEYEYQQKTKNFYKLVNRYLEDAQRSQGCLVVYTEIEDGDYNPELQDFEPRFVNSHFYRKDRSNAELELSEAFNEDFEPTFLEVADEYDAATSACLEMRYQKFIPEPICHIFFCEKTGTRWFTDISGTCYRQLPGQKPIEWEECHDIDNLFESKSSTYFPYEDIDDGEDDFFEPEFEFVDEDCISTMSHDEAAEYFMTLISKNEHVEFPSILLDKVGL